MHYDHAGIVTNDLESLVETYTTLFDATLVHEDDSDGVEAAFLELENGYLELMEPYDQEVLSGFLERNGPGIHHLAIRVDDIEAALEDASEQGVDLIDEQPQPGSMGHRVAFLHPRSTGGVLVQFVE